MTREIKSSATFQIAALTPPITADPSIAIAASRAGYLGMLDLEFVSDHEAAVAAMQTMARHAGGSCGVKLHLADEPALAGFAAAMPENIGVIILTGPPTKHLRSSVKTFHAANRSVMLEVTSLDQAKAGSRARVDGFIAKGCEAGGFIGEKTAFILMQQLIGNTTLPVWVQGGIGLHTAAACYSGGAQGVVLDLQLALLKESLLPERVKRVIARMDGGETLCLGARNTLCRICKRPGLSPHEPEKSEGRGQAEAGLRAAIRAGISWEDGPRAYWPIGQDAAFASTFASRYRTVGSLLKAISDAVGDHVRIAKQAPILREGAPLAQAHATLYPITQGPMARVSDNAPFLARVADAGALPFAALARMRPAAITSLLTEVSSLLGNRAWGVGLLGFIDSEELNGQLKAIEPFSPKYAIIAGGRPEQAALLEARGTHAYVHIPSPALLELFIEAGVRRFIFEGNECGGHIGPRPGFVLWESVIEKLLQMFRAGSSPGKFHLLFAGGIHDARSAAAIATMAAPLAQAGVKVGIQMGTAYLMTEEIVASGAILGGYQKSALHCSETVVLETSPGHALRCCDTPFVERFLQHKRQLASEKQPAGEIRNTLERLIAGRSRIGSKGMMRNPAYSSGRRSGKAEKRRSGEGEQSENAEPYLVPVDADTQHSEGLFLIGQLAALRNEAFTMQDLHRATSRDAEERLRDTKGPVVVSPPRSRKAADIAIIGMACFFPKANSLRQYWHNLMAKVEVITEVPAHRWDWRLYFDEDRHAKDKIYSKWGGFMDDMLFDPTHYGMPPKSVESVDPMQLMALEVARRTLIDAGYEDREFDREMASVIIGASGGAGDVGVQYGLRAELPRFQGALPDAVAGRLPEWTEDTFAGILLNVIPGRIANRLNLGGVNYTTDAACASSLAAIYQAVGELTAGRSNLVIAGGVDTVQGPFGFMCFAKTQALSPRGRCRPFDAAADGIVISEGIAMLALKRLEDAEADGDRIYAVIKGVGGSSDGKAKGLTVPLPAAQRRAMRLAYDQAGFGPETVGLFEAHGTGTAVGDTAELESTTVLLREAGSRPRQAAIGSVKSLIGHTKATAGVAGLIKTTLALYHRVLPPHAGVEQPNQVFRQPDCPLYFTAEVMPWLAAEDLPRRAGVSAFGFGGTNFHVVLEQYDAGWAPWLEKAAPLGWPAELFLWHGADRRGLAAALGKTEQELQKNPAIPFVDAAYHLAAAYRSGAQTLAIIAADADDLLKKVRAAANYLANGSAAAPPPDVYYGGSDGAGAVALLFPGQGSQYTGMFRELAIHFPVFADTLAEADELLSGHFAKRFGSGMRLSHFIFPRGCYDQQARAEATKALISSDVAQPALGAVSAALSNLMMFFGLRPSAVAGHSYGEFPALFAADVLDFDTLMILSEARGRFIMDGLKNSGAEFGTMAAVRADRDEVQKAIADIADVVIANHNAPRQCVISGAKAGIEQAAARMSKNGLAVTPIPVAAAFHTAFVEPARSPLADLIRSTSWRNPTLPVYSNTTGDRHAEDPAATRQVMTDHLVRPVEFVTEIEAMYRDGARVFIELGPKSVLTRLVGGILKGRPHTAIAIDDHGGGITGLLHAFAGLLAAGVSLNVLRLFEGRVCRDSSKPAFSAQNMKQAWLLNGSRARRATEPVKPIGVRSEELNRHSVNPAATEARTASPAKPNPGTNSVLPRTISKEGTRMQGGKQTPGAGDPSVFTEYFDVMRRFLEMQERVMSMYLGAGTNSRRPAATLSRHLPFPAITREPAAVSNEPVPPARQAPVSSTPAESEQQRPLAAAMTAVVKTSTEADRNKNVPADTRQPGSMDRPAMASLMLKIFEEKTGYPPDMVGLSQNLEADLGVDSIKRVEIIGALIKALPSGYSQALGKDLSSLNSQPTINGMLDHLQSLSPQGGGAVPFDYAEMSSEVISSRSFRHVMVPEQEAIDELAGRRLEKGHFIITPDRLGVAEILAAMLAGRECKVTIVDREILTNEELLHEWALSRVSEDDGIAGIIHLVQIGPERLPRDCGLEAWRSQLQVQEKSLFILLRDLSDRLKDDGHVLAASSLGGLFGRDRKKEPGLALQGGAVGLLKSLREEREHLRVKAVDIDQSQDPEAIARCLLAELELEGGRLEVGYPAGSRTIFRTVAQAAFPQEAPLVNGLVVLATGGGKGITAELLRELAVPGNTLLLTGRSERRDEPEELKAFPTAAALRQHFIAQVQAGSLSLTPAEIGRQVRAIVTLRELNANIKDFAARGAAVEYFPVNVTSEAQMQRLFEVIHGKYAAIHGVVHGAGIIEDKLLADKTSASWSRVVETKVLGLLLLQKYLRAGPLKFFTVMSSVAGRYGNSGQSDYATANELMNRLCCQLRGIWENVLVKAFCWGPWGPTKFGAGMVTKETEAKFAGRNIFLVSAETGRRLYKDELTSEGSKDIEVVCGEGPWEQIEAEIGRIKTARPDGHVVQNETEELLLAN